MHPRERPFWKAKTTSCTWIKICVENIDVRGINSSYTTSRAGSNMDKSESSCDNQCPICLSDIADSVVLDKCKHRFCNVCITEVLKRSYRCPVCQTVCRQPKGNQPEGTMTTQHETFYHLPGYGNDGVITIRYIMPSGIQSVRNANIPLNNYKQFLFSDNVDRIKNNFKPLRPFFNSMLTLPVSVLGDGM